MIIYYNSHDGEMFPGKSFREITCEELHALLAREDIIIVLYWGTDFFSLEKKDMTPLIQVYSRCNNSERYDSELLNDSIAKTVIGRMHRTRVQKWVALQALTIIKAPMV